MKLIFKIFIIIFCLNLFSFGELNSSEVLLLVNLNSPSSKYVANLYRQYYPSIQDNQVFYIDGLNDCSGVNSSPSDEIITREQYESCIADPLRQYLVNNGMTDDIKVFVTTAGLPYRIEDTNYSNIIYPGGSSVYSSFNIYSVNASSVESELTMLFLNAPINNRIVNPYQGYRGIGINQFDRDFSQQMNWFTATTYYGVPPIMEGEKYGVGAINRNFNAGNMFLTCRLDGPKNEGKSAIFSVHDMLERSARASTFPDEISSSQSSLLIDYGGVAYTYNRIHNLNNGQDYIDTVDLPDAYYPEIREDYRSGFEQMTGSPPEEAFLSVGEMSNAHDMTVICDLRTKKNIDIEGLVSGWTTFGVNGDEGRNQNYIKNSELLFANGAVFTSIESFNATTMFSDFSNGQGKIIDFLSMGGSGAIGHSFEPYADAVIDTEFLFYNLFCDADGDGISDMTFVESSFTALPFLSWSEVVVGDPLMRISYGDTDSSFFRKVGDVNFDDIVTTEDFFIMENFLGAVLGDGYYNDIADINQDGEITYYDAWLLTTYFDFYNTPLPEPYESIMVPEPSLFSLYIFGLMSINIKNKGELYVNRRREEKSTCLCI